MVDKSNILPQIVRAEYDPGNAFPAMIADAKRAAGQIKGEFEKTLGGAVKVNASKGVLDGLAAEAGRLRAQLDPMYSAQQRFNQAMDSADNLLQAGAISQREYAAATGMARDAIQQANSALFATQQTMAKMANAKPLNMSFGVDSLLAGRASIDKAAMSGATLASVMGRIAKASSEATGEVGRAKAEVAAASAAMAELYRQGSNAVESGRLLDGIYRKTAEAFGHTTKSARESAAVFQEVFAAQDRAAAEAGQAAQKYASDLELVRQAIDPTRVAQQQLDAELTRADAALSRGSISMQEYGIAVNRAADNYQMMVTGAREGTTANHLVANSTRAVRTAMLQAGQQIQDVGISLYSGQKASVVFAQQLPQLAFALTGLEGSANKTHDRIGRFATFLSGPWGLAVGLAVGVLGSLVAELFTADDAADKAGKSTYDFTQRLDLMAMSAKQSADAMQQLIEVTKGLIREQGTFIQQTLNTARFATTTLQQQLDAALQEYDQLKSKTGEFNLDPTQLANRLWRAGEVKQRISDLRSALKNARISETNAEIAVSQMQVTNALDATAAATNRYNEALGQLNQQRKRSVDDPVGTGLAGTFIGKQDYEKKLSELMRKRDVELEAAAAAKRKGPKGPSAGTILNREQRVDEFGDDVARRIASMRDSFMDIPQATAQANAAMATLADLSDDIAKKLDDGLDPARAAELQKSIAELKPVIWDSVNKPFEDMLEASDQQRQIDEAILAGKRDEAEVLKIQFALKKQIGALTPTQLAQARDMVVAERERSRELQKQNELQQRQVQLLDDTYSNIRQTTYELLSGKGVGAIGNLFKRQMDTMLQNMADSITEDLFGDLFRDEKDRVLGFDKVQESSERVQSSFGNLVQAANGAASALAGVAANDNPLGASLENAFDATFADRLGEIVVNGNRVSFKSMAKELGKSILGNKATSAIGGAFNTLSMGMASMQMGNGLVKSLGLKSSKTGAAIGTAIGSVVGLPIVGSILGSILGGLFKKTPKGQVVIGKAGSTVTGSKKLRAGLTSLGGGVSDSLANIAEALGGNVGDFSTTIRQKGKKYYVNGVKVGKDAEEAARVALLDAIKQGAVKGIMQGAQRLIQAGSDIEKQLAKAVKFQSVFDELQQMKDPAGYAIKMLNRDFENLIDIFKEAGASADEYAQLEELYGLKRAEAIKSATEAMTGSLKQLIDDLTIGDSGLSLGDRLANARAEFNPLADAVRAGQTVNYDDFTEAARAVIELSREMNGSQSGYFADFNDILGLSRTALAGQANVVSIASAAGSPFSSSSADTVPVVGAIDAQSQMLLEQLTALNSTNQQLLNSVQSSGASSMWGTLTGTYF